MQSVISVIRVSKKRKTKVGRDIDSKAATIFCKTNGVYSYRFIELLTVLIQLDYRQVINTATDGSVPLSIVKAKKRTKISRSRVCTVCGLWRVTTWNLCEEKRYRIKITHGGGGRGVANFGRVP